MFFHGIDCATDLLKMFEMVGQNVQKVKLMRTKMKKKAGRTKKIKLKFKR